MTDRSRDGEGRRRTEGRLRQRRSHRGADARQGVGSGRRKGQAVEAGERLLSIEAMKMETAVSSPMEATLSDVLVTVGASVETGDLLMILE